MNNLGDTSFNKRNLLKQGLGVNLYPLPFAKGGSLPKAQFGQKLSKKAMRSKARAIAGRDLDLNLWQRRKKYGDSGLENLAESALRFVPTPAGQALRTALRSNDIAYNIENSASPGVQAFVEAASSLPVFPKVFSAKVNPREVPQGFKSFGQFNRQLASSLLGRTLGDAIQTGDAIADLNNFGSGTDNPLLPFFPDKRRPSIQVGVPMRFIRQERRKLLQQRDNASKSRKGSSPFGQGGSMPEYQMGGEMDMMSNAPQDLSGMQYNTPSLGEMPSVRFGHLKPKAPSPIVRSSVMPAPTPVAPRVQNMSAGPRTIGGGYRYNAGFGQGRPASGSITRRPNVRTKFQ